MASAAGNQYSSAPNQSAKVPVQTGFARFAPSGAEIGKSVSLYPTGQTSVATPGDATPHLDRRPFPASGQFYGSQSASVETRASGVMAWSGGKTKTAAAVIDRDDAPFYLNINVDRSKNV